MSKRHNNNIQHDQHIINYNIKIQCDSNEYYRSQQIFSIKIKKKNSLFASIVCVVIVCHISYVFVIDVLFNAINGLLD